MKKLIAIVMFTISTCTIHAQNPITDSTSLSGKAKEEYLIELFTTAEIVGYTQQRLDTSRLFLKIVNVKFTDTTFFFTATVYSAFCTTNEYLFGICEGVFIELNDGGKGAQIDANDFIELPELKKIIDDIVNKK